MLHSYNLNMVMQQINKPMFGMATIKNIGKGETADGKVKHYFKLVVNDNGHKSSKDKIYFVKEALPQNSPKSQAGTTYLEPSKINGKSAVYKDTTSGGEVEVDISDPKHNFPSLGPVAKERIVGDIGEFTHTGKQMELVQQLELLLSAMEGAKVSTIGSAKWQAVEQKLGRFLEKTTRRSLGAKKWENWIRKDSAPLIRNLPHQFELLKTLGLFNPTSDTFNYTK